MDFGMECIFIWKGVVLQLQELSEETPPASVLLDELDAVLAATARDGMWREHGGRLGAVPGGRPPLVAELPRSSVVGQEMIL